MSENRPEKRRPGRPKKVVETARDAESNMISALPVDSPFRIGGVYKLTDDRIATNGPEDRPILMTILPFEVVKMTSSKIAVKFSTGAVEVHEMNGRIILTAKDVYDTATDFVEHPGGLFQ